MSQAGAAYRFYPWLRRGVAAQLRRDFATAGSRATLPVAVTFNSNQAQSASTTLELVGPGDVVQFDPRAIARTWPPANALVAETNYFPMVELDQVDLPWRYTPRADDPEGRVSPWLCLLVFTEAELGPFLPARAERPLESVTIKPGTPMPPPAQTWAWCHVQVSGDDDLSLEKVVTQQPERCLARLMCPRRLTARATYWAVVVPTFEVGRRAGLRLPLGETAAALAPAWTTTTLGAALELPVYYRWRFTTGAGGDFEALAQALTPAPFPTAASTRALDASRPGGGLPAASAEPMALGGALRAPQAAATAAPVASFQTALTGLLNRPFDALEKGGVTPVVAPPLYGAWHARRARLDTTATPPWFRGLNLDPRTRIAASLGTEVVQQKQHELMASAWAQVDGIREANARLRMAQLARALGERLHRRHIQTAGPEDALVLTAPVLARVRVASRTARDRVNGSPPRFALLSGALRRLARPLGPLGRRQARPDVVLRPAFTRVNTGELDAVLALTPPPVGSAIPTRKWVVNAVRTAFPTASTIVAAPVRSDAVVWDPIDPPEAVITRFNVVPGVDSPSMLAFRTAAATLAGRTVTPGAGGTLQRVDALALKTAVEQATQPRVAFAAAFAARAVQGAGFSWSPPDPLEPVMAHPVFPQPMYKPLAELSPAWMLPGLADLPRDSVTVAETNPAFIEAYLVGLNHEMSRELLWNEYPSDQRGSYFRQFWDPAGLAPAPTPETLKDIHPIHLWPRDSALGTHSPRPAVSGGTHLVVVVRGELLHRYPNTLVYAQRASRTTTGYALATERREPVFAGRLRPDVAFFGFALTSDEARGTATTTSPGWFFVFQEQPGEPRFGLDATGASAPTSLYDLAWTHLVASPDLVDTVQYIDLASPWPATASLETAGGPGWHLTAASADKPYARGADHAVITCQRPVRVALHGAQLLP